jgi:hypothetical protein
VLELLDRPHQAAVAFLDQACRDPRTATLTTRRRFADHVLFGLLGLLPRGVDVRHQGADAGRGVLDLLAGRRFGFLVIFRARALGGFALAGGLRQPVCRGRARDRASSRSSGGKMRWAASVISIGRTCAIARFVAVDLFFKCPSRWS